MAPEEFRSSWIKWARAVELQQELARGTREYAGLQAYEYVREDNAGAFDDPLIRAHWRLRIAEPRPERWSVLIGDVLTNFRAALDHAFWYATNAQCGPPAKSNQVYFPIATTPKTFKGYQKDLAGLVSPAVWKVVESVQPVQGGTDAYMHPLAILQWLNNADKHRAVHPVLGVNVDMGPILVEGAEMVEEWHLDGPVQDGMVVARLKLKRPAGGRHSVELKPTFGQLIALQISDSPDEIRSLDSLMEVVRKHVLNVLIGFTTELGIDTADLRLGSLNLGEEHLAFAAEFGGEVLTAHQGR